MDERVAPFGFIFPAHLNAGESSQLQVVLDHWHAILDELSVAQVYESNREDILGELMRRIARELVRGGTHPADLAEQLRMLALETTQPEFAAPAVAIEAPPVKSGNRGPGAPAQTVRLNKAWSVVQAAAFERAHKQPGLSFGPLRMSGLQVLEALWWNETPDAWNRRGDEGPDRTDQPTIQWLVEATLLSAPTVREAVKRLREHGFVE